MYGRLTEVTKTNPMKICFAKDFRNEIVRLVLMSIYGCLKYKIVIILIEYSVLFCNYFFFSIIQELLDNLILIVIVDEFVVFEAFYLHKLQYDCANQ